MTPIVTLPRGFSPRTGHLERVVALPLSGAILVRHVSSFAEASACREAWAHGDFRAWPGSIRYFDERGTPACSASPA